MRLPALLPVSVGIIGVSLLMIQYMENDHPAPYVKNSLSFSATGAPSFQTYSGSYFGPPGTKETYPAPGTYDVEISTSYGNNSSVKFFDISTEKSLMEYTLRDGIRCKDKKFSVDQKTYVSEMICDTVDGDPQKMQIFRHGLFSKDHLQEIEMNTYRGVSSNRVTILALRK